MRPEQIAKQAFQELGKHGPDGVFVGLMFVLLIVGAACHIDWWLLLVALVICLWFYDRRRCNTEAHAVEMAVLSVQQEEATIAAIKGPLRTEIEMAQPQLPLEPGRRRLNESGTATDR